MSGKNIKPKRQLMASKVLSAKGSAHTSQTRVSIFLISLFIAFSRAISSMSSERSVITTLPPFNIVAMVKPGSPVPAAMSNTTSAPLGLILRMISSPIGFNKSIFRSSHFFQLGENLFQVALCWSRISSSGRLILF